MSLKNIRATCSHINLYMMLSSLSIIVHSTESRKSLAYPPFVKTHEKYESKSAENLEFLANGRLSNMTISHKALDKQNNKMPAVLARAVEKYNTGHLNPNVFPNHRMGLDIKEVVLTNLNFYNPKPVVIKNHEEYSRDDTLEFSSRQLLDYKSAIGKL